MVFVVVFHVSICHHKLYPQVHTTLGPWGHTTFGVDQAYRRHLNNYNGRNSITISE